MIYFDSPSQSKLVDQFAEKLKPNGYLIIGHSESLLGLTDRYKSLGDTVYRCTSGGAKSTTSAVPSKAPAVKTVNRSVPVKETQRPTKANLNDLAVRVNSRANAGSQQELHGEPVSRIIVGEVKASEKPMWISTLLGSCVAVCLYDEIRKIGGMNHFMLPDTNTNKQCHASYGIHAMELLINAIMGLGGDRRRLKAKLFGGCVVGPETNRSLNIGRKNIDFATEFLERESIPVVASYVGGNCGMRIDFHTHTNKVLLRSLDPEVTLQLDRNEIQKAKAIVTASCRHHDITLFE